jgi:hypothetical protein
MEEPQQKQAVRDHEVQSSEDRGRADGGGQAEGKTSDRLAQHGSGAMSSERTEVISNNSTRPATGEKQSSGTSQSMLEQHRSVEQSIPANRADPVPAERQTIGLNVLLNASGAHAPQNHSFAGAPVRDDSASKHAPAQSLQENIQAHHDHHTHQQNSTPALKESSRPHNADSRGPPSPSPALTAGSLSANQQNLTQSPSSAKAEANQAPMQVRCAVPSQAHLGSLPCVFR